MALLVAASTPALAGGGGTPEPEGGSRRCLAGHHWVSTGGLSEIRAWMYGTVPTVVAGTVTSGHFFIDITRTQLSFDISFVVQLPSGSFGNSETLAAARYAVQSGERNPKLLIREVLYDSTTLSTTVITDEGPLTVPPTDIPVKVFGAPGSGALYLPYTCSGRRLLLFRPSRPEPFVFRPG